MKPNPVVSLPYNKLMALFFTGKTAAHIEAVMQDLLLIGNYVKMQRRQGQLRDDTEKGGRP